MEPDRQVEIQLGHMCNNRCVFCVSGQRTAMGEAFPLPVEPILERIREARAAGHAKITLLGGEPTLQPGFMDVVRECVALGFTEIVIFTNGVKTARAAVIDDVRATGGRFTWRISIQGATKESHERTTKKDGSFDRIVRTLENLAERGERITVNMCVVGSNYESVDRFPELLLPFGATQLHLDLMRPMDAGERTEDELRELMPRFYDMAPPLVRMVGGFPEGFDVNIGNFPYCVAPELAPFIHHDGEHTETIAIDGDDKLSRPWNKYFVKKKDKEKPATCATCVFEAQCSGVFSTYRHFHGTSELVPVTHERLVALDPKRRFLALHLRPVVATALSGRWDAEEKGVEETWLASRRDSELRVALRRPASGQAFAEHEGVALHLLGRGRDATADAVELRALGDALRAAGYAVRHPVGDDAVGRCARSVAARIARLRSAAPFGALLFRDVILADDGARAELLFEGPAGEHAIVWLGEESGRARGGYRLEGSAPATPAVVEGLAAIMGALGALPISDKDTHANPG